MSGSRRLAPRPATFAISALADELAPQTALSRVQRAWRDVVGDVIADQAEPVSERDGTVTVTCSSAVWAQELDLLSADVVSNLNEALLGPVVTGLRCQAAGARKWPSKDR
ncbi:MAG TPA: DUF721 domain-containing protein [Baekduia sp.]|nr:DUF721 domain-containing protein [Baekduia sp.]